MASSWAECLLAAAALCYFVLRPIITACSGFSLMALMIFKSEAGSHTAFSPAFQFLAAADGIVCGLSIVSVIMLSIHCYGSGKKPSLLHILLLELVMTGLMISACSAAIWEFHHSKCTLDCCFSARDSLHFSLAAAVGCFILTIFSGCGYALSRLSEVTPPTPREESLPVEPRAKVLSCDQQHGVAAMSCVACYFVNCRVDMT